MLPWLVKSQDLVYNMKAISFDITVCCSLDTTVVAVIENHLLDHFTSLYKQYIKLTTCKHDNVNTLILMILLTALLQQLNTGQLFCVVKPRLVFVEI